MGPTAELAAIAVVSLVGAAGAAAVTVRHYEPPPREGADEPPEPLFEAAIFFLMTGALFAIVGYVLATVGDLAAPYGRVATLLLTPLGYYSAYAAYSGKIGADADQSAVLMGVISGAVIGTYPVVFDVLSLL